jgi:hypothetical protein
MMGDTIYLSFSWQDIPVAKLNNRLMMRFFGPLRWIALLLAVTVLFASFNLLQTHVFPHESGAHVSTVLAAIACALMLGVGNTLGHKRLQAALMAAPIRQRACSLAINQHGVAAEGGALYANVDWADVTEIAEMGNFVLIMMSPLEYIPIPDFSLPPDMTRAELVERLRYWHGAANPATGDNPVMA